MVHYEHAQKIVVLYHILDKPNKSLRNGPPESDPYKVYPGSVHETPVLS